VVRLSNILFGRYRWLSERIADKNVTGYAWHAQSALVVRCFVNIALPACVGKQLLLYIYVLRHVYMVDSFYISTHCVSLGHY
jgi:hypothetical protein